MAITRTVVAARSVVSTRHSLLLNGLLAHWPLDVGAGLTQPSSGGDWTLNPVSGAEGSAAGLLGNALSLDGNTAHRFLLRPDILAFGKVPTDAALSITQSVTVSVWARVGTGPTTNNAMGLLGRGSGAASSTSWFLYCGGPTESNIPNRWGFKVFKDGTTAVVLDSGATWAAGAWTHLLAWIDSENAQVGIRVNGGAAVTTSLPSGLWWLNPLRAFVVGNRDAGGSASGAYNGLIDELALWNRTLSTGEQDFLYGGGTPPAFSTW